MTTFEHTLTDALRSANAPLLRKMERLEKKIDEMRDADKPEFLTIKQAAKILKCCDHTVRRKVHEGKLPCRRDGRSILIRYDDVVNKFGNQG